MEVIRVSTLGRVGSEERQTNNMTDFRSMLYEDLGHTALG